MSYDTEEKLIMGAIGGVLIMCLVGLYKIEEAEAAERERLIEQCMDDGKKEYECRAMYDRQRAASVPIIIPMYTGR